MEKKDLTHGTFNGIRTKGNKKLTAAKSPIKNKKQTKKNVKKQTKC